MMSGKNNSTTRRKALKVLGTAATTSVITGVGAAKGESPSVTSRDVAERRADAAFNKSLRNWHAKVSKSVSSGTSDDVGTADLADPRADVYIGTDEVLNPNYGDKYVSDDADSMQDSALSASYDTSSDYVRGRAYDWGGYGTFRAWSYIGREFVVHGDSAQTATITVRPDVCGDMTITGEGDNTGKLALIVRDIDDNEKYTEYVFNHDGYVNQWCDNSYVTSQSVVLEPGHGYEALVKLTVGTTFTGDFGGALSDFNQKTDGDETVDVGSIDVKF